MSLRNTMDKYWKAVEVAPVGIALQVQVTNAAGDLYVLPFPCKLTTAGWVSAVSGTALVVKPRYWNCMLRRFRASGRLDGGFESDAHETNGLRWESLTIQITSDRHSAEKSNRDFTGVKCFLKMTRHSQLKALRAWLERVGLANARTSGRYKSEAHRDHQQAAQPPSAALPRHSRTGLATR